jgi:type VI secretion system secreted protein VgrG
MTGVTQHGTLSGWHSHNLPGAGAGGGQGTASGYNQWVLDDSTAQLRMKLASSSAASQLSTGYLISQNPNSAQRGNYRGSGFELRTDAWGVIRAPQGLLLSSTARAQNGSSVSSSQMDTSEAQAQLKAAQNLTNALHQAAKQQQALDAEQIQATAQAQQSLLQNLDPQQQGSFKQQGATNLNGQSTQKAQSSSRELNTAPEAAVERFATPLIVAEAPSAIVLTSAASSALFAGEQLQLVSQGDSHLSAGHTVAMVAGKTQSFFSHAGGLEAVAANGALSLQAHTDQLELLADKEVTVVSVNDSISIYAQSQIVLKAGQSSITLDGANITFACPGTFSVKGSGHSLGGGASVAAELPALPDQRLGEPGSWIAVSHMDPEGQPLAGQKYKIHFEGGVVVQGTLDAKGYAMHEGVPKVAQFVEYEVRKPEPDKPWQPLDALVTAAQQKLG